MLAALGASLNFCFLPLFPQFQASPLLAFKSLLYEIWNKRYHAEHVHRLHTQCACTTAFITELSGT